MFEVTAHWKVLTNYFEYLRKIFWKMFLFTLFRWANHMLVSRSVHPAVERVCGEGVLELKLALLIFWRERAGSECLQISTLGFDSFRYLHLIETLPVEGVIGLSLVEPRCKIFRSFGRIGRTDANLPSLGRRYKIRLVTGLGLWCN